MEALKYYLDIAVRKCRQYPIAISTLVLAVVLGLYVWSGGDNKIQLARQLTDLQSQWERMERNLRNATGLESQLEEMQELRAKMRTRMTRREEVALNLNYFYRLEQQSNVSISSINQLPASAGQQARHLPTMADFDIIGYSMTIEGSFNDVLSFLQSIQQGEYFARIENVNFGRGRDQAGRAVSASIQVFILGARN